MTKNIKKVSLKNLIKELRTSGFFYIFEATMINSLVSFVYGIFLLRIMSKHDFGVFSYTQNITSLGFLFSGLGVNLGLLQFCSDDVNIELKNSYGRFSFRFGSVCSITMGFIMILYAFIDHSGFNNLAGYIMGFSFMPLLYFIKDWFASNLRWQMKNREYSIVLNIHTVTNAVLAVVGAYVGGIWGVISGIYLAYFCAIVVGYFYLRDSFLLSVKDADPLEKPVINSFLKYSITMCVVNALISALYTIDIFVIGNIMQDVEAVAMYKAASVVVFAMNIIPNSIMTYVYPHVAKNRDNRTWLKKNIKLIYIVNGLVNLLIGAFLYIFAPLLITILFGDHYDGILPVFRILIMSYIINACFRTPAANLFGILRKTRTALIISSGTVVLSVVMSILFVDRLGIVGASIGSVCTFGVVGLVSTGILINNIY